MNALPALAAMEAIVSAIGEEDFLARTARALCDTAGFDLSAVLLHRPASTAILHQTFTAEGGHAGLERYARCTHRSNPMLAMFSPMRPGAVRASDFRGRWVPPISRTMAEIEPAPEEELGFRTLGWPARLEEIGLYLPLADGIVELGLYRERAHCALPDDMLAMLDALGGPVAAAFARHRVLSPSRGADWRGRLTPRERDIADLLLIGCSTDAIAGRLGLSRHTVKDHRKHIFARLGISSLAELFALARTSTLRHPHAGGMA